ncbi:TNF receptor-associated factor 3, partial [Frankliniella fusca]
NKPKFMFSLKLRKKWWDSHLNEGKRYLKGGWADPVLRAFENKKAADCHCSPRILSNRVTRRLSSNAFTGVMGCISPKCKRTFEVILKDHPCPGDEVVRLKVYGVGESNHSRNAPFRAQVRGKWKREQLANDVENSRAKVLKRKLLSKKASDPKGKCDLGFGNFTNVPTSGTLRNLAYESRKSKRLDDNPWINLSKNAAAINEKYGEGSVFILSEVPLKVAWATKNQLLHIAEEAAFQKILGVYLDSTGSEARPASFDVDKKGILTYNLSLKRDDKGNPPIPVSTCLTNDQHEYEVSHWLSRLRNQFEVVTKCKKLPFKYIVIDLSRALLNACVLILNGMASLTTESIEATPYFAGKTLLGADPNCLDEEFEEALDENHDSCESSVEEGTESSSISSLNEKYSDSPFFKMFKQVYDDAVKEVEEDDKHHEGEVVNPYNVPKFMAYLLQYILPFYPLWSRYVQAIILPGKENPLSNSPSELMHKLDKEESLGKKTFQEVTEVMVKLIEGAEERLLEVKYPTDFTRYNKRKNKTVEEGTNVPEVEKWKRNRRRKRVKEGLYSKICTVSYAQKLVGKSMRAAARMKPRENKPARKRRSKKCTSNTFVVESMLIHKDVPIDFDELSVGEFVGSTNKDDILVVLDNKSVGVGAADINKVIDSNDSESSAQARCAVIRIPEESADGQPLVSETLDQVFSITAGGFTWNSVDGRIFLARTGEHSYIYQTLDDLINSFGTTIVSPLQSSEIISNAETIPAMDHLENGVVSDMVQVSSVCNGPSTNADQNLLPKVFAGVVTSQPDGLTEQSGDVESGLVSDAEQ